MTCEEFRAILKTDPRDATPSMVTSFTLHHLKCPACRTHLRNARYEPGPRIIITPAEIKQVAERARTSIETDPEMQHQIKSVFEEWNQ